MVIVMFGAGFDLLTLFLSGAVDPFAGAQRHLIAPSDDFM